VNSTWKRNKNILQSGNLNTKKNKNIKITRKEKMAFQKNMNVLGMLESLPNFGGNNKY